MNYVGVTNVFLFYFLYYCLLWYLWCFDLLFFFLSAASMLREKPSLSTTIFKFFFYFLSSKMSSLIFKILFVTFSYSLKRFVPLWFFLFRLVIWTYCLAILLSFPAVLYYIYVLVFNIWLQYFLPPMFYVILFYFHIAKFFYQVLLLCRRSCLLKGSS